ncbi:MAG: hypothetical protein WCG93_07580 [Paludibacter sp.]
MHTTNFQNTSTIRFRRWSRMGYAVFCSLACSVSIGRLAVSVSDKTLQKSVGNTSNAICFSTSNSEDTENPIEKLELEATLQQIQAPSFIQISVDSAAACSQSTIYIINCNG